MELQPLSCDAGVPWEDGNKVLSYIKEVEYFGLTGEIVFDTEGLRTHFMLDLMEKFHNRMKKTAIWTEKGYWTQNVTKNRLLKTHFGGLGLPTFPPLFRTYSLKM